jgi:hypothetical protein
MYARHTRKEVKNMELLPEVLRNLLPPLYSTEDKGDDAIACIKFFAPNSGWTWYATEGSPVDDAGMMDTDKEKVDFLFFGLVYGIEPELGYFSLSEFENSPIVEGVMIERDRFFKPTTLRELRAMHEH